MRLVLPARGPNIGNLWSRCFIFTGTYRLLGSLSTPQPPNSPHPPPPLQKKTKNPTCAFLITKTKVPSGCSWLISGFLPTLPFLSALRAVDHPQTSSPHAVLSFQTINERQPIPAPSSFSLAGSCLPLLLVTTLAVPLATLKRFK